MNETVEGPVKRVSSLLILIILVTLILSIAALYQAIAYFGSTPPDVNLGSWFMFLGITGLALSTYMVLQMRRKVVRLPFEAPKVITTILCQECGMKNIRDFQRGDYIFKETEPCPKCKEQMIISSIYREVEEKEKS